jgi:hypothetical protein
MATLEKIPKNPPRGQIYLHQNLSVIKLSRMMETKNKPVKMAYLNTIGWRGNTAGRMNWSKRYTGSANNGIEIKSFSISKMMRSIPGRMVRVMVRVKRVRGSKSSKVRLLKIADIRIVNSSAYLNDLILSGTRIIDFLCLNLKTSRIVPKGQSQPHHALPTTRLENNRISDIVIPPRNVRLLIKLANIARGLSLMGKFVSENGARFIPVAIKVMIIPRSASPWIIFRAITHRLTFLKR